MMERKRFSQKKFEKDRDKATKLSKSGFRLDTLSDDLHLTIEARKRVAVNSYNLSDKELAMLRERAQFCGDKSALDWCTLHVVKRTKPECKVCENNT